MRPDYDYSEEEVLKHLEYFTFEQAGCRMIQRMMDETTDSAFLRTLINRLLPMFKSVSQNIFGNFLCQKVIECCTSDELRQVIELFLPNAVEVSLDQHGTRTMQSIIEALYRKISVHNEMSEEMLLIIEKLSPEVLALATDVHGNHVI